MNSFWITVVVVFCGLVLPHSGSTATRINSKITGETLPGTIQEWARVIGDDQDAYMDYIRSRYPILREDIDLDNMKRAQDNSTDTLISPKCEADLRVLLQHLFRLPIDWSNAMIDSFGMPEAGQFSGNDVFEGRWGQCTRIFPANLTGADGKPYRGRPCAMVYEKISLLSYYTMCLPSTCQATDVKPIFENVINPDNLPFPYVPGNSSTYAYCEDYDKDVMSDPAVIGATCLLSFFGLLLVIGTIYEAVWLKTRPKPCVADTEVNRNNNNSTTRTNQDTPSSPHNQDEAKDEPVASSSSASTSSNESQSENGSEKGESSTSQSEQDGDVIQYETHFGGEEPVTVILTGDPGIPEKQPVDMNVPPPQYINGGYVPDAKFRTHDMGMVKEIPDNVILNKVPIKKSDNPGPAPGKSTPGTLGALLMSFSVYKNTRSLASVDHPRGSIHCLHGIRFLAMVWIVLGHTFQLGIRVPEGPSVENAADIWKHASTFHYSIIDEMHLSVESFFILSAMLNTMSLINQIKKNNNKMTPTMFGLYYLHRYLRLTPVYMILLMIWMVYYKYLNTGPVYPPSQVFLETCKENWWKHPIYMSNLIDLRYETDCFAWTWYLPNDFQFYVIAPLFICLLAWVPVAGIVMTTLGFVGGLISTTYINHGVYVREDTDPWYDCYVKPWCRCCTYFIGIFLGYLLYRKQRKMNINIFLNILGWVLALGFIPLTVYTPYYFDSSGTAEGKTAFFSLQRPIFGLAVSWIILACTTGNGGFINSILSWRVWVPLSRLTYTGYILHPMILYYTCYSTPVQIYYTHYTMIYFFLGHLMLTLGASYVVSVTFEIPFIALEKVMLKNVKK